MSARSRNPDTESFGIESSSVLASSRLQTGVLPFLTTYFGPRTACAGLEETICLTTKKSYNMGSAHEIEEYVSCADPYMKYIFVAATLPTLATLGLLSLAGSNRAAGTDSQKGALKTGAQLWAENCIMCHEDRPWTSFSPAQADAIKRHMRKETDLSQEEQEAILGFLKSGN